MPTRSKFLGTVMAMEGRLCWPMLLDHWRAFFNVVDSLQRSFFGGLESVTDHKGLHMMIESIWHAVDINGHRGKSFRIFPASKWLPAEPVPILIIGQGTAQ